MNSTSFPQSLLQQAAQISRMERGTLSIIREGPEGPYYNHQSRRGGKNVTRYVPRDQVPAVQEAIEGHRKFMEFIDQYVDEIVDQTRQAIAADSKKNPSPPSPPSSSTPRAPRSKR